VEKETCLAKIEWITIGYEILEDLELEKKEEDEKLMRELYPIPKKKKSDKKKIDAQEHEKEDEEEKKKLEEEQKELEEEQKEIRQKELKDEQLIRKLFAVNQQIRDKMVGEGNIEQMKTLNNTSQIIHPLTHSVETHSKDSEK
jgi:seryl-tRNA synthetase